VIDSTLLGIGLLNLGEPWWSLEARPLQNRLQL